MGYFDDQRVQNQTLRATSRTLDGFVGVFYFMLKALLTIMLVLCIAGTIVASGVAYYVFNLVDSNSGVELEHLSLNETSIVYAMDPQTQKPYEVTRLHGSENRIWANLDEIPQYAVDAAVAIEDKRFWEHKGVDWKRTVGAFANSLVSIYGRNAGGSTLTQQLIKNVTNEDEVSFDRKIKEIMRALDLEKKYSKEMIIEAYLNTIHLGSGCNGIQAAANKYFNKNASELSLAECASIIGITQFPTKYNPLIHADYNKERQEVVLRQMFVQGYIDEKQYEDAVNEKLQFAEQEEYSDSMYIESDYTDMVVSQIVRDLQDELGYTREYANRMIYYGGLRIYMAVDDRIQEIMEKHYADPSNFPSKRGAIQPQSSMTVLGYDGRIVGVIGRIGEKTVVRDLNRATQSKRSTGSSMKPLGAYGPAINENAITYSTKIENQPITVNGRKWPPNYGGGGYGPPVTVQYAVMRSLNTCAVRTVEKIGLEKSFEYATERFGLDLIRYKVLKSGAVKSDLTYSALALGGFTYGTNTRDMAAGFQTFGNGGKYNKPWCYYQVTNAKGDVLLEHKANPKTAIESDSAWVMNMILRTVAGPGGTGSSARFSSDWTMFAKTGTSGSAAQTYDVTFCGGTPAYVAATWFGYDYPRHLSGNLHNGASGAWRAVMKQIHSGMTVKKFEEDPTVRKATYCAASGDLIGPGCPSGGTGYYRPGNMPPVCNGVHIGWTSGLPESSVTTSAEPSANPSQAPSSKPSSSKSSSSKSSKPTSSKESSSESSEESSEENE
ncbi:MAG: penicillin-binding protein [Clostridia bacterium]|nr:penicillin-binding protein [Clostridia bacterium]